MVKRCPNCGAVITGVGEGDSVICWYCKESLVLEEYKLMKKKYKKTTH